MWSHKHQHLDIWEARGKDRKSTVRIAIHETQGDEAITWPLSLEAQFLFLGFLLQLASSVECLYILMEMCPFS